MASSAGGSASFIGPSERLEVLVVQGAQASDPIALAEQDQTRLAGSLTGYQKVSRAAAMTIGGRHVVKVVYTWNAGASAVTGNAVELTTARYYIPKDSGLLAVIAYSFVSNQYDPQGADDVASIFRWQ